MLDCVTYTDRHTSINQIKIKKREKRRATNQYTAKEKDQEFNKLIKELKLKINTIESIF